MYKKTSFLVILLTLVFVCNLAPFGYASDAPGVMWEKTFGGIGWDSGSSVQVTGDGGYIITGYTGSFGVHETDVYLVKTNSSGHMMWNKTFGSWGRESGSSVQVTGDGGYIITGYTGSYGGGLDVYLIKTDSNGNWMWAKNFGGTNSEGGRSVQVTGDGGYIVAGGTSSFGAGGTDVYLVKTDSGGNLEWEKTFGGEGSDYGTSVQVTADGGYIITGYTTSSGAGGWDVYLVKTDSSGNLEWEKTFGGIVSDSGSSVQITDDGGYIITGNTLSYGVAGETDVYLIRTDSDGNLVWEKTFGGAGSDYGSTVQVTADGGYILAGHTTSFGAGETDVYLVKTDSTGTLQWEKTFGGTLYEVGYSVQETSDGGYIITGDTRSSGAGSADVYLIRTDPQGEEISQEETYSAWIVDVVAPSEVYVGEEFTVDLTVSYDFTVATEIMPGVFEYGTHETLVGTGTKTYSFVLDAPEEGVLSLSAAVLYTVEGELIHNDVDWVEYFDVQVIALPEEGTYTASIVDFVAPSEASAGEAFSVELTVAYEFSELTEITPKIYDKVTGMWLAEESETLVGAGSKTYSFELTAPEEGAWTIGASVWYTVEGELAHDEMDWNELSYVQVTAVQEDTYSAGIVDVMAPSEVYVGESFTVEITVSYDFSVATEIRPGVFEYWIHETLVGTGTKTYSFELTAPEAGSWVLEASVEYISDGELVHDEVDWVESFDVQVTPLVSDDTEDDVKWEVSSETEEDDSTVSDDTDDDDTEDDVKWEVSSETEEDDSTVSDDTDDDDTEDDVKWEVSGETEDDDTEDDDTDSTPSSASEVIDSATSAAEEIIEGLPDEVKKQIPGFPVSSIISAFVVIYFNVLRKKSSF